MEDTNTQQDEILKAVSGLSGKFDGLSERVNGLSGKFDGLSAKTDEILEAVGHFSDRMEERTAVLESEVSGMKSDITGMKSDMVTKTYLDDKLFDLKGDLITLTRKEDQKLVALVRILETRNVISEEDKNAIFAMEPFPYTR